MNKGQSLSKVVITSLLRAVFGFLVLLAPKPRLDL
jgi:hypothetical protein